MAVEGEKKRTHLRGKLFINALLLEPFVGAGRRCGKAHALHIPKIARGFGLKLRLSYRAR